MPWKDGQLPEIIILLAQYVYAPALAFGITVLRGLYAGGKPVKTLLEAFIIGLLTLALVPLLRYFDMPEDMSIFLGSFCAFMGVDWIRAKADTVGRILVDRWGKK